MPHSATPLASIVGLASRQHGVVDTSELAEAGVANSTLRVWVGSRRLFHLHRGVYSIVPPSMLTTEARWLAAVRACAPGAFLSHGPAGQLQGILPRQHRYAFHVSLTTRRRVRLPGIVVHRPRHLDPADVTTKLQIPTTTITRTVWDLASTLSSLQTRRAFEQAEKQTAFSRSRLTALLLASPSRKGAGAIRGLLAERPLPLSETRSWLEELLLITCRDNGLPLPAVNVPLLGYEVDFLWPRQRFVVDIVLGRAGHLVRRHSSRAMGREAEVAREVVEILTERSSD